MDETLILFLAVSVDTAYSSISLDGRSAGVLAILARRLLFFFVVHGCGIKIESFKGIRMCSLVECTVHSKSEMVFVLIVFLFECVVGRKNRRSKSELYTQDSKLCELQTR